MGTDVSMDSAICVAGSRFIRAGFLATNCTDNLVIFVNSGGEALENEDSNFHVKPDIFFQGGDVLRTDEPVIDGGNFPSIYQSARFGNFCYQFENLSPGDYFVDLHFAEIVNTNGPKGMRVFDVFIQEEKVLSELDIYSIVRANKPLQLVDVRVSVTKDGMITVSFEGVHGSPVINGICIRRAPPLAASEVKHGSIACNNCAAEIELSSAQSKLIRMKFAAKYEKKIEELSGQCQLKSDECYEAWMSLTAANKQLEDVRAELDKRIFQNYYQDQAMEKQAEKLRDASNMYEHDKKFWVASINELESKIKNMKREHSQLSCEAHKSANSIPDLNKMIIAVQAIVAECDDLKLKYSEEQEKRKKLYNQIQEAKGNIRVFCRCRPLSKEEVASGHATIVDFTAAKDGELAMLTGGSTKKIFKFDRVYTPNDDQVDISADASPMVISVLDGYNVCIFAYGQTGTGKTFTMEGTNKNRGVNYRTLEQLFKIAEERKEIFKYTISVSVLEVYNEQIRDLLATSPTSKKLEIRQATEGVHHVPGIVEAKVENIKEVWDVLQAGSNGRAVGSNNVNEHSSRSHCMLCIMVRAKNLMNGECTNSKLWLVDLAGSERLAKTEVQGERLKEAQNINRSLSALGDVISALATKSSHVPYRNSKLTHLLQDSLGGDSKTLMFVQISPSEQDLGETLSSLNFATRVRGVELGPAKKQIDMGELQRMKMMLDRVKQESNSKDEALRKLEENFQNLEGKAKSRDQIYRNQKEKVNELELQLESKTESCRQLEKQLLQLSEEVKKKEEIGLTLQQKVKELENKVKEHELEESKTHKVKELENKLKERTQDFELHTSILKQKIKELESKLVMQGESLGFQSLEKKNKGLEEKLRQPTPGSAERPRVTPNEQKAWSRTGTMCGTDPQSLRSLNSSNGAMSQSGLLKGADSLRELRRKRELQSKGIENNFLLSASLIEHKTTLQKESNKGRHIDPSKALARVTRITKLATAQRPLSNNRINREQQATGVKERDNRTRVWSR
ncbi:kinesin-like protein KIN-14R isoform X2 [Vitis vinifera]|uniref:kinesin-like protein KIN-14R isoform X2 n=1 Tax=Vitis vinifera TaxID=29760 RepID=UPI00053FF03E|nr:kinesin-like protein KIN-14R isoform X2 [Vitis vinifera]|eukprot:XP_002283715.3 PREDICTED: kinesin-like protein KIN-14R isoform X2 [Vitis vinifera]